MKLPKFINTKKNDPKQFALEVKSNVNKYFSDNNISKKGNATMIVKSIVMLSMYILPFILLLSFSINIWLSLFLTIVMGVGFAGIGMSVMHDAIHGSYSKNGWVNRLFASTIYLLGSNEFNWKMQHNVLHHTYTNIEGHDEDIKHRIVLRFSEFSPLYKIHKYQHIYALFFYGLLTIAKHISDFSQIFEYHKNGFLKKYNVNITLELLKITLLKTLFFFTLIGIPLLFTDYLWWEILIGFSAMCWTAGIILSVIFQMAHIVDEAALVETNIDGNIENEWMIHELETTANFARNNSFLNWYIGGLNFQIEHHLFPNICHIHYKNISKIVEETANKYDLKYNVIPKFYDAIGSHFSRLKKLGVQPQKFH